MDAMQRSRGDVKCVEEQAFLPVAFADVINHLRAWVTSLATADM